MGYTLRNQRKWAHRVATEVSRTINGNLDGSLDGVQVQHIIQHALAHRVSDADIIAGFQEAAVGRVDGRPIEHWIQQTHRSGRHDN